MAGRKPSKENFLALLLGKVGLAPAKKKKQGRRRTGPNPNRPRQGAPTGMLAPEEASAFAEQTGPSSLGYTPDDAYEVAAALGYAPPPPRPLEPLFPESGGANLPFQPAEPTWHAPVAPAAPAFDAPADGKLFSQEALDSSLDALFSGLEAGDVSPFAVAEPEPTPAPLPTPARLGLPTPAPAQARLAPPPPASGPRTATLPFAPVSPIVSEPAAAETASPPIAAASEPRRAVASAFSGPTSRAGVVVLSQGTDLRTLLATIDRVPGTAGSLLVGHDGLIIATSLPPDVDRDYLGAQACSLFTHSGSQSHKMRRGELQRLVLETENGAMLMMAADMGILVVVSQDERAMDVTAVAAAIAGALGQG